MPDTASPANLPALYPTSNHHPVPRGPLQRLIDFDRQRPGIPGEHLVVAALGGWLIRSAMRRRSTLMMLLSVTAGGLLLARAASGRDGLARLASDRKPGR